jgi:hypothetical protein
MLEPPPVVLGGGGGGGGGTVVTGGAVVTTTVVATVVGGVVAAAIVDGVIAVVDVAVVADSITVVVVASVVGDACDAKDCASSSEWPPPAQLAPTAAMTIPIAAMRRRAFPDIANVLFRQMLNETSTDERMTLSTVVTPMIRQ